MGGSSSRSEEPNTESTQGYYQQTKKRIRCEEYVSTDDIRNVIRTERLLEDERQLLQEAVILVARESDWIFRNCEIRVIGSTADSMDFIFYAGAPNNIYVITEQNGEVDTLCKSKSLRHHMRDAGRSLWSWISATASKVAGAVTGAGMKALTYL